MSHPNAYRNSLNELNEVFTLHLYLNAMKVYLLTFLLDLFRTGAR